MESVAKKPLLPWQLKIILSLVLTLATGILLYALGKPIPWQLEMCLTMTSALGVGMALLFIPKKQLARIGQIPGLDPNWITFWGFYFWWVGVSYFYITHDLYGMMILSGIGGTLDVVDGKMATAMKEEGVWRSAISKRIGKWFDPLCDKLKYPPIIALFSFAGIIFYCIVIGIIISEIFGTLIRNPINIGARMYWQSKKMDDGWRKKAIYQVGKRLVRKSKASGFGKVKATIQSLGLMVCVPYYRGWYLDLPAIPNVVYSLALAFGVISIASRMRIHPKFDRLVDRLGNAGSLFKHRDLCWDDFLALFGRPIA